MEVKNKNAYFSFFLLMMSTVEVFSVGEIDIVTSEEISDLSGVWEEIPSSRENFKALSELFEFPMATFISHEENITKTSTGHTVEGEYNPGSAFFFNFTSEFLAFDGYGFGPKGWVANYTTVEISKELVLAAVFLEKNSSLLILRKMSTYREHKAMCIEFDSDMSNILAKTYYSPKLSNYNP